MAQGTLVFCLSEERTQFMRAVHSTDMAIVLWDLDEWLRGKIKHEDREDWQEVRDKLHELLEDNSIDLDRLLE